MFEEFLPNTQPFVMHKYYVVLLGIWLGLLSGLSAQTLLRGRVYDRTNQEPISQVRVLLLGTTSQDLTDSDGYFQLANAEPGVYKLRFEHPQYRAQVRRLQIQKENVFSVGISLIPLDLESKVAPTSRPHGYFRDPGYSPYSQTLVKAHEWQQRQAATLPEALGRSVGIWRNDPHYATSSLQIRGLGAERLTWSYEEIPLTPSAAQHSQHLVAALIDPFSVSQVEIQRGTGGIRYGHGASAGVIHLHSQAPAFSTEDWQIHGKVNLQGQAPSERFASNGQVSLHRGRIAARVGGAWQSWQPLRPGKRAGRLDGEPFHSRHGAATVALRLSPNQMLTTGYRFSTQQDALLLSPFRPTPRVNLRREAQHQLGYMRYVKYSKAPWLQELRVTAGYQRLGEWLTTPPTQPNDPRRIQQDIDTWSGRAEVFSEPFSYWHIVTGVDLVNDQVRSSHEHPGNGSNALRGPLPEKAQAGTIGAYTQHSLDLLKLHVVMAGRVQGDLREGRSAIDPDFEWTGVRFSGNLSGMYSLSDEYQLVSNIQTGYRVPTLFEQGGFAPIAFGWAAPADSTLTPERSITSEIGLKANTKRFSGSLILYRTQLRDRIGYEEGMYQGQRQYEDQPVFQAANQGLAYVAGIEASVEVPVGQMVSLYGSVVYSYGEELRRTQPVEHIPPINSRLGVHVRHRMGIWSRMEWRYAAEQTLLSPLDRLDPAIGPNGVPAWNMLDLQVGYDFRWGYVTLGLFNMLDASIQSFGAGIPLPGRRFVGSMQIGF